MLKVLADESEMLSQHGVRTLSAKDQFFQLDSNLYRGNIFIHLNYLLLRGLKKHYVGRVEGAAELYETIRERVVSTVFKGW